VQGCSPALGTAHWCYPRQGQGLLGLTPHPFITIPELITPPYHIALAPFGELYQQAPPTTTSSSSHSSSSVGQGGAWLPAMSRTVTEEPVFTGRRALSQGEAGWLHARLSRILTSNEHTVVDGRGEGEKVREWETGKAAVLARDSTGTLLQRRTEVMKSLRGLVRAIRMGESMTHSMRVGAEEEYEQIVEAWEVAKEDAGGVRCGAVEGQGWDEGGLRAPPSPGGCTPPTPHHLPSPSQSAAVPPPPKAKCPPPPSSYPPPTPPL
jgi:hypothetical protein